MTRIRRLLPARVVPALVVPALVVTVIVAAVVACGAAAVPAALTGVWRGGAHSNGPWLYAFTADGHYRTWPERDPGAVNAGTVVVDGDTVTFSNGDAPVTSTWSVSGDVLVLDGQRYDRTREAA